MIDVQKEYANSNRKKDKIIVLLIVLMFLEAIVCYTGFVYYESQFDYVETYDTTKDVDIDTKGDNANAEYNDVNGNVLPKFVKSAIEQYKEWEEETKELYEEMWQKCINIGLIADAEYISTLVEDVTKELKKINRMHEQLNGTGYNAVSIHGMQDKYHEKYKKKYNEEYTNKEAKQMKEHKKNK